MGVQSSEQRSAGVYLGRCSRSERPRANLLSRRQSRNMNYSELFQIKPGSEVHLKKIDPNYTAEHTEKKSAGKHVEKLDRKLRELQYLLYAENKRSLLICMQ